MKNIMENLVLLNGISNTYPNDSKVFKQFQFQGIMKIPAQKPDIEQIISISVNVEVTKTYVISTASGRSCEGQVLTGSKLAVEGKLHQKLEYIAATIDQPIHTSHFIIPFASFIILGTDIQCYSQFEVTGYVEDIYVKKLDKRKIFKSVLLLLNAVPISKI